MAEEDLAQANAPFVAVVDGVTVVVRVGDVYRKTDPVYRASFLSFQDIDVLDSRSVNRPISRGRGPGPVETATAAPGERRTLTAPPPETAKEAGRAAAATKKDKAGAAAAPAPSEV